MATISNDPRFVFRKVDICDGGTIRELLRSDRINVVMHLAAESHVDRSIDGPAKFIETNVVGTFHLLEAALAHWRELVLALRETFRFHHVSTDEVFGDLTSTTVCLPRRRPTHPHRRIQPPRRLPTISYALGNKTYGLPIVLSNCSNNYGPYHFPEKLIPLVILEYSRRAPLPIYGAGQNVRDWLFVEDHARALELVATKGTPGESYNIGGRSERTNLSVVESVCDILDARSPRAGGASYRDLITFVTDRPGHDRRYAIDASKVERELGWVPLRVSRLVSQRPLNGF
ncbi:dTDP-glucose 4,6-dehydratase [Neoaquamicrobium sediminum]|uniref:dTDP-glucose 4,6-dehydratase n=1 Tax=Neoaquamicrobium sediminum TaxID=1849104 RepID=UPI001FD06DF3|nr:GDP-mannose 4,6-dehydratase [Mesorhizobium sediminum]